MPVSCFIFFKDFYYLELKIHSLNKYLQLLNLHQYVCLRMLDIFFFSISITCYIVKKLKIISITIDIKVNLSQGNGRFIQYIAYFCNIVTLENDYLFTGSCKNSCIGMYAYIDVCIHVLILAMYVCIYVCICVCRYACMYLTGYVFMYICMYMRM